MFEGARYRRQPLGNILRDMVPKEHIPRAASDARAQGMAAAAVKNLRWIQFTVHLRPCADPWFVRQACMARGSHIFHMMLNWALPERCPCCGAITSAGGHFCVSCWQKLEFLGPPWCRGCATPFEFDRGEDAYCASCIGNRPRHDGIRAAVKYDDLSAQVALRLKYGGKIGLARVIAQQMLRHLPEERENLLITPVPLHWTRIWSRSFNQSALIGKELAALSGIEFVPDILVRHKRTPTMRGLDLKRRRKAVGNAFALHPKRKGKLKGQKIILIDDVLTTGATSDGCVSVLKRHGASWVQIFCWARALRGRTQESEPMSLGA